jgi:ankyrin repeat protein
MTQAWRTAALTGDVTELRTRLEAGQDVDARDQYGQTALMLAARLGHLEAVRALVEAGADLDHTAKYRLSALMLAAVNGREDVARLLADAGADTSLRGTGAPGFHGKTALDLAEDLGHESIANLLRGEDR